MTDRRRFLGVLTTAALAAPFRVGAQALRRVMIVQRVPALAGAITAGLRERGWVPGRNVAVEVVGNYTLETISKAIEAGMASRPEVIAIATPFNIAAAAKAAPRTPIVGIDLESDPVAFGFARTLARPGGNITGIWLDLPELGGKNAQLLRELIPGLSPLGALWDERQGPVQLNALEATGRSAGFKVLGAPLREAADVDLAVERLKREGAKGLVVFTGGATFLNRERIVDAALKHRLPLASLFTNFPDAGGLVAYGPNVLDMFRQSAGHIDRILRGAKPGDVAIERPVKFELVINAMTAKKLGIAIPETVRIRADRVIEV